MERPDRPAETIPAVRATLTYLVESDETLVTYPSESGTDLTRYTGQSDPRVVPIRDGRARSEPFSLDREGFELRHHETAVSDLYDDAQIAALYEPEIRDLVVAATGGSRVEIFDHTRRADTPDLREAHGIREPSSSIHNDYTAWSAPRRVRDLLPEEADGLLARRFAIVNVWRPIRGPLLSWPLALCDARSVAPGDLVSVERRAKDRVGEIQQALFNPAHRWVYFPRMEPDEVLLIKTYDSAEDGRARFTLHTAFEDPTVPADAPPRESIETRAFVFF